MMYFIVRNSIKLFLKIYMGFRVYGADKVPKKGAFILAGNHVSHIDPPAFASASPRPLHFMARHTLFENRALGWLIGSCNSFPVKRDEGDVGALKEAIRRLKRGSALLIFPEGTRSVTGEIQKAEPGVGYLSLMTGVPILPAYVKGTNEALPKGAKRIIRMPISVYFGGLVVPQKLDLSNDRRQAAQEVADRVVEEIRKLEKEAKNPKKGR